ncbi:hypothetical protein Dxin01_02399 [Deinococcus xinjiangensis]|uniref:Uncharacterized protein n=1 Tax=Deinococcus xinjiangensis TaxID=457454 RepID=A0ABP9VEK2_9DEIO
MTNDIHAPAPLKVRAAPSLELAAFLNLWQDENYAGMARKLRLPMKPKQHKTAREVRGEYEKRSLLDYRILSVRDTDAAASTVTALLRYSVGEEVNTRYWQFRMVYLDKQHQPLPRDQAGGKWVPVTASVLPDPPAPEPMQA